MLQKLFMVVLLASATLFAENTISPHQNSEPTISPPNTADMLSGYKASASLKLNGGCDFSIYGSFVYYQAIEDQLELAYTSANNADPSYGNGSVLQYNYKWTLITNPVLRSEPDIDLIMINGKLMLNIFGSTLKIQSLMIWKVPSIISGPFSTSTV